MICTKLTIHYYTEYDRGNKGEGMTMKRLRDYIRPGRLVLFALLLTVLGAFSVFAAAPAAVTNLKATAAESTVTLKWSKVAGASGYYVYQEKDGVPKKVATLKGTSKTSKKFKNLKNNKTYTYTVCAYTKSGSSIEIGTASRAVTAKPKIKNPGRVSPKLYGNGNQKVIITWTALKKASSYEVYQKNTSGAFVKIGTVKKNKVTVKKLKNGMTYAFKIRAVRTVKGVSGYGDMSKEVSGKPSDPDVVNLANVHGFYYKAKVTGVGSGISLTSTDKKKTVKFKAGTKVIVTSWGSSESAKSTIKYKNKIYKIKTKYLTRYNYSWNSSKPYNQETAEAYINYKGYTSAGKYFIWISTYTQHLYIFEGSQYNWRLIDSFKCSTAKWGHHTYYGFSRLGGRQKEWPFGQWQVGYYASLINGGAIHSELYYYSGEKYTDMGKLGEPASHGCVRVEISKAKWIYDVAVPTESEVLLF